MPVAEPLAPAAAVRDSKINRDLIVGDGRRRRSATSLLLGATLLAMHGGRRSSGSTRSTSGLGIAGYTHPVFWGVYIVTFVFWVGIAHAGTLISAILYLFRAKWRNAINRSAEAMTVFAVMTAGHVPRHPRRPHVEGRTSSCRTRTSAACG